jgi:hypothetical protein
VLRNKGNLKTSVNIAIEWYKLPRNYKSLKAQTPWQALLYLNSHHNQNATAVIPENDGYSFVKVVCTSGFAIRWTVYQNVWHSHWGVTVITNGAGSSRNKKLCERCMRRIRCRVSITSSFLTAMKEEFHAYTDGFIMCSYLSWVSVHSSCHKDKRARWRKERPSLPRALSKISVPCKAAALAAASAASLLRRPVLPGTQQNKNESPVFRNGDSWLRISFAIGWSGEQLLRICRALKESVHMRLYWWG